MKKMLFHTALISSMFLAGCASDRGERRAAARGALIGAAGGAALGAITGGDALEGAAIGAAGGAVIGAITHDGRRRDVYRDDRGRRYWVDDNGAVAAFADPIDRELPSRSRPRRCRGTDRLLGDNHEQHVIRL